MAEMKTPAQVAEDWLFEEAPELWQLEASEILEVEDSVARLIRQRDEEQQEIVLARVRSRMEREESYAAEAEVRADAIDLAAYTRSANVLRELAATIEGRKEGEGDG